MKRSFHSHLSRMLREAHAACREAEITGVPIDEVTDMRAERAKREALTRRDLFRRAGSVAAIGAAVAMPRRAKAWSPRIVIVGGGLAGIRCAHALWYSYGLSSSIYEASSRAGGRVETLRGYFNDGQITEQCGEFVSSEHASMLGLASYYGLKLDLAEIAPAGVNNNLYFFHGSYYTQSDLNADWQKFGYQLFVKKSQLAPWRPTYYSHNATHVAWDKMNVPDWINAFIPGGTSSPFGSLCYQDAISEYGGLPEQQSALNLLYVLAYDDSTSTGGQPAVSPVLAGTDEKYHINGGNDQIVTNLVNDLPDAVKTGQQLTALKLNYDGSYTCSFQSGSSKYDVGADHVVLAIPFTTLRKVDLSKAGFSSLKMKAIQNLQLGTSGKIQLQFSDRIWYSLGYNATTWTDNGAACSWECTDYQPGGSGILITLAGGAEGAGLPSKYGLSAISGPAPSAMANDTLNSLNQIFPGVKGAYNGKGYYTTRLLDPHVGGAWSYYSMGQYTGFCGIEPVQEGNVHFAGEHTSTNYQGYMEGAVTTGEAIATEIANEVAGGG